MTVQAFTRVVQLPSRGQITIPTEFRRRLGLAELRTATVAGPGLGVPRPRPTK